MATGDNHTTLRRESAIPSPRCCEIEYLRKDFANEVNINEFLRTPLGEKLSPNCMDIDTVQATSLLFCSCFDSFNSEMFALLLNAGISTKFCLQLFTNDAESIAEPLPFWLTLINSVVSRAMNYFTDESELRRGFEILEMVLDVEEQSRLLIITDSQQSDYSGLDFAISLRDFVCGLHPLNMQRLLELLPVSDFPRPQEEQVLDRCSAEHS